MRATSLLHHGALAIKSFALYRRGHDAYVVVHETMSPPIDVNHKHGQPMLVHATPMKPPASTPSTATTMQIEIEPDAVTKASDIDGMFEMECTTTSRFACD